MTIQILVKADYFASKNAGSESENTVIAAFSSDDELFKYLELNNIEVGFSRDYTDYQSWYFIQTTALF